MNKILLGILYRFFQGKSLECLIFFVYYLTTNIDFTIELSEAPKEDALAGHVINTST